MVSVSTSDLGHVTAECGLRPAVLTIGVEPPNFVGRQDNIAIFPVPNRYVLIALYTHGRKGANESRTVVVVCNLPQLTIQATTGSQPFDETVQVLAVYRDFPVLVRFLAPWDVTWNFIFREQKSQKSS